MMHQTAISSALRRGFTLVEMVTSLAILCILVVACGSIVAMATRATGNSSTNNAAQMQIADAANQLTDDLNVALNFTQRTATATTFTVPDRLGSGTPQTVSYSWSGNAGDALLRQFNGGASTAVLANVQQLNLLFSPRLMGPPPGPPELILFSHDAPAGGLNDNKLDNKNWASQSFSPSLPTGTSFYTLTRVRLMLKNGNQSNAMRVSLVMPDILFRPTGATVAQTTVYQSALSQQYEWIDIPFTGLSKQNPLQPLCIVLSTVSGSTDIGSVQDDQSMLSLVAGADWSTSSNGGTSWSNGISTTAARVYVFGTVP